MDIDYFQISKMINLQIQSLMEFPILFSTILSFEFKCNKLIIEKCVS